MGLGLAELDSSFAVTRLQWGDEIFRVQKVK